MFELLRICRLLVFIWVITLQQAGMAAPGCEFVEKLNTAIDPQPQNWQEWRAHSLRFSKLPYREKVSLVFLGDSIIEGWNHAGKEVWNRFYSPRNAVNFGIAGDRTQHLLWRIQNGNLNGIHPKVVVVLIGTNNIKEQRNSPPETTEGILAVTSALLEKLPQTKILLLGIFPCGEFSTCQNRNDARAVNILLEQRIKNDRVQLLCLDNEFLESDGTLSPKVMPDFLHLSSFGYQRWADAMETYICAMYEEDPCENEEGITTDRPSK